MKARILAVSSTKRMPAFTKKLIRETTAGISAGSTLPEAATASTMLIAVARAKAISWTGVAPASWRW